MSSDDIRRTINTLESLDKVNEDLTPAEIVGLLSAGGVGGMVLAPIVIAIKKFLDHQDWKNVRETQDVNDEAAAMSSFVKQNAPRIASQLSTQGHMPSDNDVQSLINYAVKLDQSGKSSDEIVKSLVQMAKTTNESNLDEAAPPVDWLPPDVLGAIDVIRTYASGVGLGVIITGILSTLVNALHGKYKK